MASKWNKVKAVTLSKKPEVNLMPPPGLMVKDKTFNALFSPAGITDTMRKLQEMSECLKIEDK